MKKAQRFYLTSFWLIAISFLLISCGSGISGTGGTKEDLMTDFNNDAAASKVKESIIDIPENVRLTSVASSGKKNNKIIEDSLAVGLYGSIREFINFAEFLKTTSNDFLAFVLKSKILAFTEPNKFIPINDGGEITGYKIEEISEISSDKYKWKLSLYFNNETKERLIFRFKFVNDKAVGQMLAEIDEPIVIQLNGQTNSIGKKIIIDVKFDGTQSIQYLDVDFTQDMTEVMAFAEANWADLDQAQKETLQLSFPGKFSLRVQYDGNEYGISGSSYSPGQMLEKNLTGEDTFLSEDRSTYTFRAKSITGVIDGAKMDVALPEDTLENIDNIWVEDSFSAIFRQKMLEGFNTSLNKLIDINDDEDLDASDDVDFSGATIEEQRIGFQTLAWMLEDKLPIPTLLDHGIIMSQAEYDDAISFWGTEFLKGYGINSVEELNNILSSDIPEIPIVVKKGIYRVVMAPAVIAYYQLNTVQLTLADLDEIINKSDDGNENVFRNAFQTLSHFVNPGFFDKEIGFLGTYDGESFFAFDPIDNSLLLGEKPANFNTLNSLDLNMLDAVTPNEVYNLVIKVK